LTCTLSNFPFHPVWVESTVRFLKNVCAVVLTRDTINEAEVEALKQEQPL